MALITGMPHFLEHGVEIRMYSWAVFFASSAAIFALCVTRKIRYAGIGLTACTVLGAYTHQYALIETGIDVPEIVVGIGILYTVQGIILIK